MLELNQTYTWKEIVANYPGMYAVITDVNYKAGEVVTCKFLDICTKAEKHLYREKYTNSGMYFEIKRTTSDNDPNSGICFLV